VAAREREATVEALRRLDDEAFAAVLERALEMRQMIGDISLGNADELREIARAGRSLQQRPMEALAHGYLSRFRQDRRSP
jgi:hypothetical protein